MRLALFALILALPLGPLGVIWNDKPSIACTVAPTLIQSAQGGIESGAFSCPVVFASNVTAGNTIVCLAMGGGTPDLSATDLRNGGAQYSVDVSAVPFSDHRGSVLSTLVTSTGANTVTIARTGTGSCRAACHEYSGIAATNRVDQVASAASSGTSLDSGPAPQTTCEKDLLFGGFTYSTAIASPTAGTMGITPGTATIRQNVLNQSAQIRATSEDRTSTQLGIYRANLSVSGSSFFSALFVAYKGT